MIAKFPACLPSAAQPNGQIQKIVGRAQAASGQAFYSPIHNRPCVHYNVTVQEYDNESWETIIEESQTVDFFMVDDNGGSVFVKGSTVKPFTVTATTSTRGNPFSFNSSASVPPGLETLMQRHGRKTSGFFGGTKTLRVFEGSFDLGEVLACLGGVMPGVNGGPTHQMVPLQQQAITPEYIAANNWDNFDQKSWDYLTTKYQCVLMSDSPELTENILAPMQQQPPSMTQPMQRVMVQQQQQPMMMVPQQQPNMVQIVPAPILMSVTIPQGVAPGTTLQLQAPDGRTVQVVVPQGMQPGMSFQIRV